MIRLLQVAAALAVGLMLGFAIVPLIFENPFQQGALVGRLAFGAGLLAIVYFGMRHSLRNATGSGMPTGR